MKILLLNQTFYPDVVSTAQHASDVAAHLVESGHELTVISSSRAYDNPRERYPKHEVWRGVQIRRISAFGFGKGSKWRRALDFGSYLANCIVRLMTLQRFDLVLAMTSPPLISWLAALFVRIKGGKLAFWVMDLNPDEALAAGWLQQGSWVTHYLESMLLYSLHRANCIVALDRFMAKRIENKGVSVDKICVIPPWSHDHAVRYDCQGRESFRRVHGLRDKFVVMHSGNHSPCHPLSTLLQAAHALSMEREIVFCFVGGGSEITTVNAFAVRHKLSNILTLPYQPLDRLAASLSSGDLHVVIMGDPFVGIVHPCKVYNICRLGIPYLYIGPERSHIAEMNPPFTARHGDINTVVQHIRKAVEAPGLRVCPTYNAEHSQDHLLNRMVSTLESAVNPQIALTGANSW